jgi:glucose/mannose transport system substrate-binding protein
MKNKKIIFLVLISVLVVLAAALTAVWYFKFRNKPAVNVPVAVQKVEIGTLTFYDWWVSPGETAALNGLIKLFEEKYPDAAVGPISIGGGAGYNMMSIVKPLMVSSQTPDFFLMHAGYEGMPYYRAGLLDTVDDIWQSENLASVVPSVVQDMNKFDGHYYSVPIDIHRVNLVWYNKDLLFKNNIDADKLATWDNFFAACDKLKAAGVKYPIRTGESWTVAHVFEQMVASEGIDFYQDWINGRVTSANDARLLSALNNLKKYLSYIDPDDKNSSWDVALDKVISGESVFDVTGDWADEEFKLAGKTYGTDYGSFIVPGTENMYGLSIDTWERPKNISHPTLANNWLKLAVTREGQDVFNPLKGSISARTDADISKYDDYQRSAVSDFWKARYMFPSVVHGSGAPQSFRLKLIDVISDFAANGEVDKAATAIATYSAIISDEYTINWSLK